MSTYGLTHWMSLASKINKEEGFFWDDAKEEAKKRLKVGQYRADQSRSQSRGQPTESALFPDLENIVTEYLDPETYGFLMQYNPQKYTLAKYEPLIAASERRLQDEKLTQLGEKYKKMYTVKDIKDLSDEYKHEYDKTLLYLLENSIEDIFKIMEDLGLIFRHERYLLDDEDGPFLRYKISFLRDPNTGQEIEELTGILYIRSPSAGAKSSFEFRPDGKIKNRIFLSTPLSPLWQLLYDTIQKYLPYVYIYYMNQTITAEFC